MNQYFLHDEVKALWKGGAYYYRGKVLEVNPNDTYLISFETGGEAAIHARHMSATKFQIGERVKVRRKVEFANGIFVYAPATIRHYYANENAYDIAWESPLNSSISIAATTATTAGETEYALEDEVITLPSYLSGDLVTVSNPTGVRYRGEIVQVYSPKSSKSHNNNNCCQKAESDSLALDTIPTAGDALSDEILNEEANDLTASAAKPEEQQSDETTYDVLVNGQKIMRRVRETIIDFASGLFLPQAEVLVLCRSAVRMNDATLRKHTGGSDAIIQSEGDVMQEVKEELGIHKNWSFAPYTVYCRGTVLAVDEAKSDVTIDVLHPIERAGKGLPAIEEDGIKFLRSSFVIDYGLARNIVLSRGNFVRFRSPVTFAVGDIVDWNFSKRLVVRCRLVAIEMKAISVSLEKEVRLDSDMIVEEWKPEEIEMEELVGEKKVENKVVASIGEAVGETITETYYVLEYKVTNGSNSIHLQRATIHVPSDNNTNSSVLPLLELVCPASVSDDSDFCSRKFHLSAEYHICDGCLTRARPLPGLCIDCAICEVCHSETNPEDMMLCDRCEKGFHTFCLEREEGAEVPTGSWYCHECGGQEKPKPFDPTKRARKKTEKQLSYEKATNEEKKMEATRKSSRNKLVSEEFEPLTDPAMLKLNMVEYPTSTASPKSSANNNATNHSKKTPEPAKDKESKRDKEKKKAKKEKERKKEKKEKRDKSKSKKAKSPNKEDTVFAKPKVSPSQPQMPRVFEAGKTVTDARASSGPKVYQGGRVVYEGGKVVGGDGMKYVQQASPSASAQSRANLNTPSPTGLTYSKYKKRATPESSPTGLRQESNISDQIHEPVVSKKQKLDEKPVAISNEMEQDTSSLNVTNVAQNQESSLLLVVPESISLDAPQTFTSEYPDVEAGISSGEMEPEVERKSHTGLDISFLKSQFGHH